MTTSRVSVYVLYEWIRLVCIYAIWCGMGWRWAGRILLKALEKKEPIRDLSGMLLVKCKRRAVPLLLEALNSKYQIPLVLILLASIGNPNLIPTVEPYLNDANPDIAMAARDAMNILAAQEK